MKIRNGFVSNSSSASFVITWRALNAEVDDLKGIFKNLFDGCEITTDLVRNTEVLKSGACRTTFATGMFNDYSDFGNDAALMMTVLYMNNDFEIIDARIEEEG